MTKFKVGDKIRFVGDADDRRQDYKNVKVEAVFNVGAPGKKGDYRIWISFDIDGRRDTATIFPGSTLDEAWELVPPMFQVGKTYRSKGGTRTIKILEVFEVENPTTEEDRITAVSRVTQADGGQYIYVHGAWECKYYEEVK